jgi:transposase-like protein
VITRRSHAPYVLGVGAPVNRCSAAIKGEPVAAVAVDTGICQATLFRWKRQAFIDAGVIEGAPSVEADELAAAHEGIAALKSELALTRDACELFDEQAVCPQNDARSL